MQLPENHGDAETEALEAPAGLVSALKRTAKAPVFIPPTVDKAILRTARRQLSREQEPKLRWPRLIRWGVAAAALVLLLAIVPVGLRKPASSVARGDLNHDGQVDILDAFALAREIRAAAHPGPQLDLNGDGVVDERDVATLAARAVSLGKGGRS